jgi:hypothetical protein
MMNTPQKRKGLFLTKSGELAATPSMKSRTTTHSTIMADRIV